MTNNAKYFDELVNERRSVRVYDQEVAFDHEAVQRSLERATLSPNSSNMQMWEFYRITTEDIKKEVAVNCMKQKAATTARELVLFTVRPSLWSERAKFNLEEMKKGFEKKPLSEKDQKRALSYYEKLVPILYKNDKLGIRSFGKKMFAWFVGLKRPMVRQVAKKDVAITLHKSVALAAMTFMYSMKSEGYDTCPMEGFDSKRIKKILNLPKDTEISMIIGCGPAAEGGIYNERVRVPNEKVIFEI
ncbi:nitroreductase family protein [Flammeovirga yaeyamensis]|uniref:Nitroreductase family protein n=1 Tax=Flammeovirga yaeyamensis TaxID=367791 RepID=A0AAX1NBM3_9BACT|nr:MULTISPECIES: nitroreductase family protein [Flammeovirga]ANQ49109.2 nitroreductase family protein [Flammeovirga sp. MY04]MBB3698028.1 nitroreductase [Flammeovirga yaeyamensis]NMF35620.1 nitroreductase family protein [Flammeovirga yaeyamensis]QWG03423.1 nitroreductase family protein [Flammeovirga yaeyamensis]